MLIETLSPEKKGFSMDLGRLGPHFATVQQFLLTADFDALPVGKHEIDGENVFVLMQEYTQQEKEPSYEAHAVYADIQLILTGQGLRRSAHEGSGPVRGAAPGNPRNVT